jgi:MoxR-like ATPase
MPEQREFEAASRAVEGLRECYEALRSEIGKVLVGQEEVVRLVLTGLLSGGHMLVVGVPGLAKTLMVRALARLLGWEFRRIQFTPDLMPADITGTEILQSDEAGTRRELVFHKGPLFGNLILADEINRTPPKTQAALLEAMQELAVTVNGKTYPLPPPFVVVATQNPIEQEGTYPLPEAQLDRFMLSIHVGYPSGEEELAIASRPARFRTDDFGLEPVAGGADFAAFSDVVDDAPLSPHVLAYAVSLTTATRPKQPGASDYVQRYVAWGVGPRGAQHLVTAAKAAALLDGRPAPEARDVREMALPVLRHRIIPNYNALGEGLASADIVAHLLESVQEPSA